MWHHPKYYKELRKRNKSDQAISNSSATAPAQRAPGQGLKLQAREDSTTNSTRGQVAEPQASSVKLQAPISLNQGTSNTQHVSKTLDRGPRPR